MVSNCALSFCASSAFWCWKEEKEAVDVELEVLAAWVTEGAAPTLLTPAADVAVAMTVTVEVTLSQSSSSSSPESSVEVAAEAEAVTVAEAAEPEPEPTPGFEVMSVSCSPSGTGPLGLAGQEPAGDTGLLRPNGIVPPSPTLMLPDEPTKVVGLVDANWHWKSPLSSAFFGADVQYGTEREVGYG